MELYQLRYFKTVAETEHFTRAAEKLHISQPSLSKSISNLEAELGVLLFERDKRAVYLNDYGRAFLKRVERILNEVDEAAQELKDMSGEAAGDVYIASSMMFSAPSKVHTYTSGFFLNNPQISLHLYILDNAKIEEQLLARKIDFGYSVSLPEHLEIEAVPLFTYRLGVVVGKDHPLARKGTIYLSELMGDRFLCNNTSPDFRDSIYELCHKAGFRPKVAFEGESSRLIGDAVGRGLGVAFISSDRHLWKQHNQPATEADRDIVYLDVLDDFCIRTVYLYQLKDRYLPAAARKYRDGLLEFIGQK